MSVPSCPGYRVRLFLSVDLVGSTAFKARFGDLRETDNQTFPRWVNVTRHFYRQFPQYLASRFEKACSNYDQPVFARSEPRVWKTIGDEIMFCLRLVSSEHAVCCIEAFAKALEEFGNYLDAEGRHLDVKGSAWLAAFPAPNVTVQIGQHGRTSIGSQSNAEQLDEDFEKEADSDPSRFEFLGKAIDAGFRTSKHAGADQIALSAELAYVLARECHRRTSSLKFSYHGREALKGVIQDRPYPIITIDAERRPSRKEVRVREGSLQASHPPEPLHLADFLQAFMTDEGIELPVLELGDEHSLPQSYLDFRKAWEAEVLETTKRAEAEADAGEAHSETSSGAEQRQIPTLDEAFKKLFKLAHRSTDKPQE